MKRQVEIFTAGCPVCEPVVAMVRELACDNCEITIHNLAAQDENRMGIKKMEEYGVKRLPSVVVDGELVNCCKNVAVSKQDLINAGIGSKC